MKYAVALKIRGDNETGFISAYLCAPGEEAKDGALIATLDMGIPSQIPGFFDKWKDLLTEAAVACSDAITGIPVKEVVETKHHEMQ